MRQRNNGQSENEILQNQFTAYLATAVMRRRKDYIEKISRHNVEYLTDSVLPEYEYTLEQDVFADLPLEMQLENTALFKALKELNPKERHVFFGRVLDGKDFEVMAGELGLGYKGIAAIYYRAIHKIKKKMEVDKNEF